MERGQTPEILRLAPNSVFVSLPPPFLLCSLPLPFKIFFSSHKVFHTVRTPGSLRLHYMCKKYLGASYTEAKNNYVNGFLPITYAFLFPYVPFLHHYMHRYDLRCGQAGLPGSCVYALRSR